MNYESEPVEYWKYRNVKCAIYCLRVPDDSRWIGYARFGDKWVEVLDEEGTDPTEDPEEMKDLAESEVDRILLEIETEDQDNTILDGPDLPNPGVAPDPKPNPRPQPPYDGPYWLEGEGTATFTTVRTV